MTKALAAAGSDAGQAGLAQKSRMALVSCYTLGALSSAPVIAMLLWSLKTQTLRSILTLVLSAILIAALLATCARTWRRFFVLTFPLWVVASAYAACTILSGKVPGRALALLLSGDRKSTRLNSSH